MSPASGPLRLRTLLATYPHTAPLKNGDVTSARVALDFKDVKPVWSGFKAMVRRQEFDVSEMAALPLLVAKPFAQPRGPLRRVSAGRPTTARRDYPREPGSCQP